MNLTIERLSAYRAEDAAGIGRLMPFLSSRRDDSPMDEGVLSEIIASPHHEQIVAKIDGKIVGTATLSVLMGPAVHKEAYLQDFVTDPEVRGQGVGSKLWDEMIAWCKERDLDLEFTSRPSREAAQKFYLSRGAVVRETNVFHIEL